ncbi:response regulator [Thermaerobacter subterraneus]|uniref:Stage 0 sporulation protein A homolog n=1 Tax=Thermaerobacter subterraneus DSM 13965 TaxID=867903 RepID=K6Q3R9_9FIRM|nr:response regulator transcription factor [Thermaerobacter subterraneus]EKP95744.1 response regulator containing a CheY-like receiver domain and an HTH DNA-binding domain [Thermaerobacter subterraneus DSM 13965]
MSEFAGRTGPGGAGDAAGRRADPAGGAGAASGAGGREPGGPEAGAGREVQRPIRVLVCDDHAILRDGIRTLLEAHPDIAVVGEAADGREAVELARRLQPDVVLLDIGMPGMNGIEATRAILKQRPETRVLILSMHDNEEYIFPILEAGAAGYVLKRSAATELVSALRAVVQGHTILHPDVAAKVVSGAARRQKGEGAGEGAPRRVDGLTERETEVLTLIAQGLTNQEIADRLFISIKTVQAHRSNIMEKLDLHDAVELTKYAIRHGLISLDD